MFDLGVSKLSAWLGIGVYSCSLMDTVVTRYREMIVYQGIYNRLLTVLALKEERGKEHL